MNSGELANVVITGIGMVTPLGKSPEEVLRRIRAGECAAAPPTAFDASPFACPVCAEIQDFEPQHYVSEAKMVRLMNRDARLAVAAARLALTDAGVKPGTTYAPEQIALYGATGLAGLPLREVIPLIRCSTGPQGEFDLGRFGHAGLKAVSPLLSFKILSNMPYCFVSINENIQGPNGIYTPWEGAGAQALATAVRALQTGDAQCALAGGCDVKTHELAFASLQQERLFEGWRTPLRGQEHKDALKDAGAPSGDAPGVVPGEGAAFVVLETEENALARKVQVQAHLRALELRPHCGGEDMAKTRAQVLKSLPLRQTTMLVSSANNEEQVRKEASILDAAGILVEERICPKRHMGDLYAAAGVVQVALGAKMAEELSAKVLVSSFGYGSTQAAFVLEHKKTRRGKRRTVGS